MNIELDIDGFYYIKDAFMVKFLEDELETLRISNKYESIDEEDFKDNLELIEAYTKILKYHGVKNG